MGQGPATDPRPRLSAAPRPHPASPGGGFFWTRFTIGTRNKSWTQYNIYFWCESWTQYKTGLRLFSTRPPSHFLDRVHDLFLVLVKSALGPLSARLDLIRTSLKKERITQRGRERAPASPSQDHRPAPNPDRAGRPRFFPHPPTPRPRAAAAPPRRPAPPGKARRPPPAPCRPCGEPGLAFVPG